MSYTIDVYRGDVKANKSLVDLTSFILFFPQLAAGPISRSQQLIPQFHLNHDFNWLNIRSGIARILWGLAKKVYIGDPMALIVNEAYSSPEQISGGGLILATYAFAIQIYCDFSGYSDIAIGSAKLLGIALPENFARPYLSCSIRDFWRTWHITLSTWLKDYLYIPLGGNRLGNIRTYVNLMITMLLGGLWHGAGWNWVIWGGLQGLMLSFERFTKVDNTASLSKFNKLFRWFITFHLVCLSWIFFRADNINFATEIIYRIFMNSSGSIPLDFRPIFYMILLLIIELTQGREQWVSYLEQKPMFTKLITYISIVILIFTFSGVSSPEFIYFQF